MTVATISRYTPSGGVMPLREAMDRLFQEAVTWPSTWERSPEGTLRWSAPSSLYETNDGYVFQVALPGVSADQLRITTQQNVLVLKGSYPWELPEDACSIWSNLPNGTFAYEFSVPGEFDPAGVNAAYRDGILTLTLPKAAHTETHTIKVTADGGAQVSPRPHGRGTRRKAIGAATKAAPTLEEWADAPLPFAFLGRTARCRHRVRAHPWPRSGARWPAASLSSGMNIRGRERPLVGWHPG